MRVLVSFLLLCSHWCVTAQGPDLIGYWHNWNDPAAPYLELSEVDVRYSIIEVSFAVPAQGTSHLMEFEPAETDAGTFLADVAALQGQGRKVLISIGGANAAVHLDSDQERDEFVNSMLDILDTYGFDGLDIDLEGSSVSVSGGSITLPTDPTMIRLIDAVNSIADQFETTQGRRMMLTMAPETAYVQGGQSAFGGIWGAYLPLVHALRQRLDILQVQLYNSGSMYGIDGAIYEQATPDFIVSQVEAVLQGFQTSGGFFEGLPPEKVAIGLPACPSAAGGGYVTPLVLAQAVNYLRGEGPRPGGYELVSSYPDLRGLMTWSVNWDAAANCAEANEYATSFDELFGITTGLSAVASYGDARVWPNAIQAGDVLHLEGVGQASTVLIMDVAGRIAAKTTNVNGIIVTPSSLLPGKYYLVQMEPESAQRAAFVVY